MRWHSSTDPRVRKHRPARGAEVFVCHSSLPAQGLPQAMICGLPSGVLSKRRMGLSPLITVASRPRVSIHSLMCVDFPLPLGAMNAYARPSYLITAACAMKEPCLRRLGVRLVRDRVREIGVVLTGAAAVLACIDVAYQVDARVVCCSRIGSLHSGFSRLIFIRHNSYRY